MWTWLTVRCVAAGRQRLGLESVADVGGIAKPVIGGHAVPSRFEIDDQLWAEIQPLLPPRPRRRRYPGRKPIPDRRVLNGILHVLHTGIAWEDLPQEYGYGSGVTAWRRLRDWHKAGVWGALHQRLLTRLNAVGAIDWSRAAIDGSHVRALLGGC
jgi:transposase